MVVRELIEKLSEFDDNFMVMLCVGPANNSVAGCAVKVTESYDLESPGVSVVWIEDDPDARSTHG